VSLLQVVNHKYAKVYGFQPVDPLLPEGAEGPLPEPMTKYM